MTLKKVGHQAYDAEKDGIDFHIHFEKGEWYLDAFNSKVKDADKAHLFSESFPHFLNAIDHIEDNTFTLKPPA